MQAYIIADHRGFSDDDTGAAIDEKAAADPGAGMNVDTGRGVCQIGNDTRHQTRATLMQCVGEAVIDDRRRTPVAEQHFRDASCRWIVAQGGPEVAHQRGAMLGSSRAELFTISCAERFASADKRFSASNCKPRRTSSVSRVVAV